MANIHYPDPNAVNPVVDTLGADEFVRMRKQDFNTAVHQDITIPMSTTGVPMPNGAGSSTGIYGPPYNVSYSVEDILKDAKPYLYQSSEIVDMVKFEDAPNEAMLKDNIRAKLSHQMIKHITENINFTRINDTANDTMTINARCYVFTKEQLYDLIVKAKGL